MNIPEANIEITRKRNKLVSISVSMPIWTKESTCGNINIQIPCLLIETMAKDDKDAEKAIQEAIQSFCKASEEFGQGVEKELQSIGWKHVDQHGKPVLGYSVSDTNAVINRILETGESYVNPHVDIAHA
jgi:hypothetical protein